MKFIVLTLTALVGVVGGQTLPVSAQTKQQVRVCEDMDGSDDQVIAACTVVINSSRYKGAKAWWAYLSRAQAHLGNSDADLAIRDATTSLQFEKDATAYYTRGAAYVMQDKFSLALNDLNEAIGVKKHADYYKYRSQAYAGLKQFDRALADLETKETLSGGKPDYWDHIERGTLYRDAGRLEDALAEVEKAGALEKTKKGTPYYYHKGRTLYLLGKYDDAVESLTSAVQAQVDYGWAWYYRGLAHEKLGNRDKAEGDLEEAFEFIKPKFRTEEMKAVFERFNIR